MINVGIIGCGFVGGALKDWLELNNPECKLFITDPAKGYNDDLSNIDIAFLQIHVRTEDDGTQDLTLMKELISKLPDVPIFVRTTILPGTSELLSKETGHRVHYMPEFLTERTHIEDFKKQIQDFVSVTSSHISSLDIMDKSVNKGNAINALMQTYKWNQDNLMAFGDSLNDIDMFEHVKYSIAMGNGMDVIKEKAWDITTSNDENGITLAIKKYVEGI